MEEPTRIVSTRGAAKRLGVSTPTINKYLRRGIIAAQFASDAGKFFSLDRLPLVAAAIEQNRAQNWNTLCRDLMITLAEFLKRWPGRVEKTTAEEIQLFIDTVLDRSDDYER